MCSIMGVLSKDGSDVSPKAREMLFSLKARGPEGFGFASTQGFATAKDIKDLRFPASDVFLGHCLLSTTGSKAQPISKNSFSFSHNGQLYNYEDFVGGSWDFSSDSEVLCNFLEGHAGADGLFSGFDFLSKNAIGEFAVGCLHNGELFAFRDFTGQKPVWFGENGKIMAFASESGPLRKIGVESPEPLLPGNLLKMSGTGFSEEKVFGFSDFLKTVPKKHSFEGLKSEFERAIGLQTRNIKNAAVLFSGGVDSSLVARAVSEKVKTKLFVAGLAQSPDVVWAKSAAKELGLDIVSIELSENDIKSLGRECEGRLGGFDSMQVAIGIPELACAKEIAKENLKVVFSGQGSDEIFCGYSKYAQLLASGGADAIEREISSALSNMWLRNFNRDDLVVCGQGLELRLPFFAQNFLREAMAIPASEKILSVSDTLRKHPVRALAREYGISKSIYEKPKKALQYGSGVQKVVSRLFR